MSIRIAFTFIASSTAVYRLLCISAFLTMAVFRPMQTSAYRFDMAAKRSRREVAINALQDVLHVGGISNSGLRKLLRELRQQPEAPELIGMEIVKAAFHERWM